MSTGFAGEIDVNPGTGTMSFNNTATSKGAGIATPFINRMVIANNGFVGIGVTVFPSALLTIGDPGNNVGLFLSQSGSNAPAVDLRKTSTIGSVYPTLSVSTEGEGNAIIASSAHGNGIFAETGDNTSWAGFFNGDVGTTGVFSGSDEKLKQNIRDFNSAMSIINALHPKLYQFKKDGNYALMHLPQGDHYGLIAQEVEKVLPNLVKQTMIKGMQEMQATINLQQRKIEELENRNVSLNTGAISSISSSPASVNTKAMSAYIKQNAPNPFTKNTIIQYYLPADVHTAQLVVFDMNGHQLKSYTLSKEANRVNIDASTLSSGQYIYSLIVDGKKIDSKTMILTK